MVKTTLDKPTNNVIAGSSCESDERKSAELTQQIHNEFEDVFNDIGCLQGTFTLQLKTNSKPYQAPPWFVSHVLQKPFQEELLRLQLQDIITPLGVDEVLEWCSSFVVVPKAYGKVRLCLDPAQLNEVLIRSVHRWPILNNILMKLSNIQYLSLIDASSRYHNLWLDEKSSYVTTFMCLFGRYRHKWLPFGAALAGNMFQWKTD